MGDSCGLLVTEITYLQLTKPLFVIQPNVVGPEAHIAILAPPSRGQGAITVHVDSCLRIRLRGKWPWVSSHKTCSQGARAQDLGFESLVSYSSALLPCCCKKALPRDVQGVVGLGPGPISLPTQIASHFGIPSKFALCLGPRGVIFLGDGPVHRHPEVDISHSLAHTPLMISPKDEYYISIKSIQINNKTVPLNTTLLATDRNWVGGTKITTTMPYTILQHSIFRPFAESIAKELSNVPPVTPMQPFGLCYSSKSLSRPNVPNIDFVMQNEGVMWRISGANSMVEARPGVVCLAFVDGGLVTRAAIEIGAYQMENYFLQFDLAGSKLGFSSSLLFHKASCNNLNFTIG